MKVGDHFVILMDKHIELVCLTIATGEGWVRGQVVNGAWEFNYDLTTGSADYWTPSGHEVRLGSRMAVSAAPMVTETTFRSSPHPTLKTG